MGFGLWGAIAAYRPSLRAFPRVRPHSGPESLGVGKRRGFGAGPPRDRPRTHGQLTSSFSPAQHLFGSGHLQVIDSW